MISKNKQRVTLAIPKGKIKELKKKAIDMDMTLSELLVKTASEYVPDRTTAGTTDLSTSK